MLVIVIYYSSSLSCDEVDRWMLLCHSHIHCIDPTLYTESSSCELISEAVITYSPLDDEAHYSSSVACL